MISLVESSSAFASYLREREFVTGYDLNAVGSPGGEVAQQEMFAEEETRTAQEIQGYNAKGEPKIKNHPQLSYYA